MARKLVELGYAVKGSTTSPEKIPILKNSSIVPYHLRVTGQSSDGNNVADFFSSTGLFVNLPYRRDLADPFDYVRQMQSIISFAKAAGVRKVIMASSTAVYPLRNQVAKEDDAFDRADDRSRALFAAEQEFLEDPDLCPVVVRFAGLYGPGREIGSFLKSERVSAKDGDAPVNLIHLDDCIGIVTSLFEKNICREIFNACGDAHPLRKDLYAHVAVAMRVKQPVFKENENPRYKIISNDKVKNILGYRFIHPGPWGYIDKAQVLRKSNGFQREV